MNKGKGPNPKHKAPIKTARDKQVSSEQSSGGGGGGSQATPTSQKCWSFELVRKTSAAQQTATGINIYGSVEGGDVQVLSTKLGLLGYVPSRPASEMIKLIKVRGGSFIGNVISKEGAAVKAKLCLG